MPISCGIFLKLIAYYIIVIDQSAGERQSNVSVLIGCLSLKKIKGRCLYIENLWVRNAESIVERRNNGER